VLTILLEIGINRTASLLNVNLTSLTEYDVYYQCLHTLVVIYLSKEVIDFDGRSTGCYAGRALADADQDLPDHDALSLPLRMTENRICMSLQSFFLKVVPGLLPQPLSSHGFLRDHYSDCFLFVPCLIFLISWGGVKLSPFNTSASN
jgi:hypothetical protein